MDAHADHLLVVAAGALGGLLVAFVFGGALYTISRIRRQHRRFDAHHAEVEASLNPVPRRRGPL